MNLRRMIFVASVMVGSELAQDRMPPIPMDKMTEAQKKAAQELIAGPRGAVFGPFVPLLRSPELLSPLQKAGLLAADVLAKKDVDKAIAHRAQWRADERRWVREGKLPQPGWWPESGKK